MPVITFKRMRQLCAEKSIRPESEGKTQKRVGSVPKKRTISFNISKKSTVKSSPVPRQKMRRSGQKVKKFQCSRCCKMFSRKDSLKTHQNQQHGNKERPFSCVFCDKAFFRKQNFEDHLRIEINERSEVCRRCWKSYSSSSALHYHMRSQHGAGGARTFNCSRCSKRFFNKHYLKIHEKREHELKQGRFLCVFCDKRYFESSKLENHLRSHIFEKSVVCELCFKSYTSTKSLFDHKRIHAWKAQRNKFFCMFCSAVMASKQCLEDHLRLHVKEYPFNCKTCWKAYASTRSLRHHFNSQPGHLQQSHYKETTLNPNLNNLTPSIQGSSKGRDAAESRQSAECHDSGAKDIDNPPPSTFAISSTKNAKEVTFQKKGFIPNFTSTARSSSMLELSPIGTPGISSKRHYRPSVSPENSDAAAVHPPHQDQESRSDEAAGEFSDKSIGILRADTSEIYCKLCKDNVWVHDWGSHFERLHWLAPREQAPHQSDSE